MPFLDELLNPIEGPNPSGANLRYVLYDEIKEARREEKVPPPGMDEPDRKVADSELVIKLATEALASKAKDLWLAAWLTEALLKSQGFAGLRSGLALCLGLLNGFWDTLYPEIEDGDLGARSAPLEFVGKSLVLPLKNVPIVEKASYGLADFRYARDVLKYEQQVSDKTKKEDRAKAIQEGKLSPEAFDALFESTSKAFYATIEKVLDECLQILRELKTLCESKFPDIEVRPSTHELRSTLEEVRNVVHGLLNKKREKEPDPVEQIVPAATTEDVPAVGGESPTLVPARPGIFIPLEGSSEPAGRLEAIRKIAEAAAFLRQYEPRSPAPYLMLRGLRWGELRAAVDQSDPTRLEAPPTEVRKHLKSLALEQKWKELLEVAETSMAFPFGRAWLDLQRFVIQACEALGPDYEAIARAVRSELKALIDDIPQILNATLMDDTPAANAETLAWLKALGQEPPIQVPANGSRSVAGAADLFAPKWPAQSADGYTIALQALREGHERRAFEILQQDIARQRSGRERFRRKMQLVEVCVSTSKQDIAQPILDDLAAAIETHKLDDWEDPAVVAGALAAIRRLSQRIKSDEALQQKLFERICRLDPAQALENRT